MYENFKIFTTEFAGRPLSVEIGKMGLILKCKENQ